MNDVPRVFPSFRYRDPEAVIRWLRDVLGFTVHARYPETGELAHAELAFGSAMIMLGPVRDDNYGDLVGAPGPQGGKSVYVSVDDVDRLYERVQASGVAIEEPPTDRDYGSREFVCRDPEGNIWSFGTYWPKAM